MYGTPRLGYITLGDGRAHILHRWPTVVAMSLQLRADPVWCTCALLGALSSWPISKESALQGAMGKGEGERQLIP